MLVGFFGCCGGVVVCLGWWVFGLMFDGLVVDV